MTIGERIQEARRALRNADGERLTQAELAERVDVSARTIVAWENDQRRPQGEFLERLAKALGRSPEWIEGGEGGAGPSRATPVLDMLDRAPEIRRFDGHLGIGSRVAMALDYAETQSFTRDELLEILQRTRGWAEEAERTIDDLYSKLRHRDREGDGEGGS